MAKKEPNLPPKPDCSVCGKPADYEVDIMSRKLVLEFEKGTRCESYWMGSYKYATSLRSYMCRDHFLSNVNITLAVSATMTNAMKKD